MNDISFKRILRWSLALKINKWFCLFILLNIFDILTTIYLLENKSGYETNPFAKFFLSYGYSGLLFLKLCGLSLIIVLFTKFNFNRDNQNLMVYPNIIIAMAVLLNISVIL